MPAQDFAGRPIAELVAAFTSGKVAARDIVEGLLERCTRAEPYNPIATLDAEIDARVYELYGLTAEEIRLVESAGK